MKEVELSYVAGFFDGEGSACICGNYSVKIMLVQKNPKVLTWISKYFEGTIYYRKSGSGSYVFQIGKKEYQLSFLKAIRPYLKEKETDVDMCLKMLSLSNTNKTRPQASNGHFMKNPNQEERRKLYVIYKAFRENKKKRL